jgi:hypothetical protein
MFIIEIHIGSKVYFFFSFQLAGFNRVLSVLSRKNLGYHIISGLQPQAASGAKSRVLCLLSRKKCPQVYILVRRNYTSKIRYKLLVGSTSDECGSYNHDYRIQKTLNVKASNYQPTKSFFLLDHHITIARWLLQGKEE